MRKPYKVLPGQNFLDAVIHMAGTIEAAADIAFANNMAVGGDVTAGQELVYPEGLIQSAPTLEYMAAYKTQIGTKG